LFTNHLLLNGVREENGNGDAFAVLDFNPDCIAVRIFDADIGGYSRCKPVNS